VIRQLFSVPPEAPPPEKLEEFPVNVQLFKVQDCAPPPEFPARTQLLSVQNSPLHQSFPQGRNC